MSRRRRSASSTRWLQRQARDPYVRRARAEGYRARSVYKLEELDRRFRLLRPGARVLDLGAAPGSWSQYAARRGCRVVAVDRLEMAPIEGVVVVRGDIREAATQRAMAAALGGPAEVVLSDLAPDATGDRTTDRLRAEAVAEEILELLARLLRPGGWLVLKLVAGAEAAIRPLAQARFAKVRFVRPRATRAESSELYLVCEAYRPPAELPAEATAGSGPASAEVMAGGGEQPPAVTTPSAPAPSPPAGDEPAPAPGGHGRSRPRS